MTINIQNEAEIKKLHAAICVFLVTWKELPPQISSYLAQQKETFQEVQQSYWTRVNDFSAKYSESLNHSDDTNANNYNSTKSNDYWAECMKFQHKYEVASQILSGFTSDAQTTQANVNRIFKDLVREAEKSMKVLEAILQGVTDFREVKLSESAANVAPNVENQAIVADMHKPFVKKKQTAYLDETDLKSEASLKRAESKWISRGQTQLHFWANNDAERDLLSANGYECQDGNSEFIKSFFKK